MSRRLHILINGSNSLMCGLTTISLDEMYHTWNFKSSIEDGFKELDSITCDSCKCKYIESTRGGKPLRGLRLTHITMTKGGEPKDILCGDDSASNYSYKETVADNYLRCHQLKYITCIECKDIWTLSSERLGIQFWKTHSMKQVRQLIKTEYSAPDIKILEEELYNYEPDPWEETTERLKKEKKMDIRESVAAVYEKTEDALLVSKYHTEFSLSNHNGEGYERDIMFLTGNKKAVLTRCQELQAEEDARNSEES